MSGKKLRIALIMGGGVSLGSFSGGALAKVAGLLQFHSGNWTDPKIDVVSGASAGSMTLGILLHHLFCGKEDREIAESMEGAWVKDIDIEKLMDQHGSPSLFPADAVKKVADKYVHIGDWPGKTEHTLFAEGTLASFALTNMNGIPVRAEGQLIRQGRTGGGAAAGPGSVFADAMQTTFYDDVVRFALYRRDPPEIEWEKARRLRARPLRPWTDGGTRRDWEFFRNAAIASGAFPVAFPPEEICREHWEYAANLWPFKKSRETFSFSYLDGGILRNEPLREAINLAAEQDRDEDVERVFILIDPHLSGTSEEYSLKYLRGTQLSGDGGVRVPDRTARIVQSGGRLPALLGSQAAYRDWIHAAKLNSRIEWYDDSDLPSLLEALAGNLSPEEDEKLSKLLLRIYRDKEDRRVSGGENQETEKVRRRMEDDLRKFAKSDTPAPADRLKFALRQIANIHKKRKLNIVAITPHSHSGEKVLIKGAFLANFGGFFHEEFRRHDFQVGEYIAHRVLTEKIADAEPLLDTARAGEPKRIRLADPAHRDYLSVPAEKRKRFEDFVYREVMTAAKSFLPAVLFRLLQAGNGAATLFRSGLKARIRSDLEGMRRGKMVTIEVVIKGAPANTCIGKTEKIGGELRTILVIAGNGAIPEDFRFDGPGVKAEDGGGRLEVFQKQWTVLGPMRRLLTRMPRVKTEKLLKSYVLAGKAEDWFGKARHVSLPCIEVEWEANEIQAEAISDSARTGALTSPHVVPVPVLATDA